MRTPDTIDRLKRFAMHLEQAVHDARHESERGASIVHFWDDDSLYFPTYGFERLRPRRNYASERSAEGEPLDTQQSPTQEDLVTHALFAAGYLGTVTMLAPHRVEYFSSIERHSAQRRGLSFSERLNRFLDERPDELDEFLRVGKAVTKLVHSGERGDIEEAIRVVRDVDPWTFVLMENTTNPWPQRVRRLLGNSNLIDVGLVNLPRSDEVLRDPLFDNIHRGLVRVGGAERTVATAIDAAALTGLAILVRRMTEPGAECYPRFYTSSARIRALYAGEEWFRELLSFPVPTDGGRVRTGTVWRDSYYYQLRARFPSLRPGQSRATRIIGPTLPELEVLSTQVDAAIVAGATEMEKVLSASLLPDGRTLLHLITDLENMGMADIWLASDPAKYAKTWREGLEAIWQLSSAELTQQCMDSVYDELSGETTRLVQRYKAQVDIMIVIARSLSLSRREEQKDGVGAVKNLGLERWGLVTDTSWPYPFALEGTTDEARSLLTWSDLPRLFSAPQDLELAIGLLLSVDAFDLAARVLDQYPATPTPTLAVMKLASRVRALVYHPDEALQEVMAELDELWRERFTGAERDRLALGCGYVAFHAWRKSSAAIRIDQVPEDPHGWADFSRRIVRERLNSFSRDRLVLAINHIVYVEAVAGLEQPDTLNLVAVLRDQASETQHYRLYDTVGWREYLHLMRERALEKPPADKGLTVRQRLESCLDDLQMAARGAYRDHEVADHLGIASEAYRRLEAGEAHRRPRRRRAP